jgi:predicted Rossmann fold flavoprotein
MAAISAASNGAQTVVCESNPDAGRKLLLTGGGRCNLTADRSISDFVKEYGEKSRFVKHCLYELSPQALRKFFADRNLQTFVQNDGCVFPASEKSSDVRDVLIKEALKLKTVFLFDNPVLDIQKKSDLFYVSGKKQIVTSKKLIIATGGLSYPQTGSKGDGYKFAASLGHKIIPPKPALVPLVTKEKWLAKLAGVSLPGVSIFAKINDKNIRCSGDMIFTHNGIGGPAALDFSRLIIDTLSADKKPIPVSFDTLAGIEVSELEKRFLELCEQNPKKILKGILASVYPQRFAACFCEQFDFAGENIARQLERNVRKKIIKLLKALPLTITGTRPVEEAIITRGGVCVDQIDSKTMESKICTGLYFAGEVIDIDGPCGGYNLQFAFSSGALAGESSAKTLLKAK